MYACQRESGQDQFSRGLSTIRAIRAPLTGLRARRLVPQPTGRVFSFRHIQYHATNLICYWFDASCFVHISPRNHHSLLGPISDGTIGLISACSWSATVLGDTRAPYAERYSNLCTVVPTAVVGATYLALCFSFQASDLSVGLCSQTLL
jgi:hypothetical protein